MKFNVRDEDGKEYKVEEIEEVKKDEDESTKPLTNTDADETLSPEEIIALKKLAGIVDKLCALVDVTDEDKNEDDEIDDEDEEVKGEQIEEVIDTDEMTKAKDSIKKSVGAIESKKVKANDVLEDDISLAWMKRYGGNK